MKDKLEEYEHTAYLPNCYDSPKTEDNMKILGSKEHAKFKAAKYKQSEQTIQNVDAVLVLNHTKNGIAGYIGGATFLEMYDAFRLGKKIYMYNDVYEGISSIADEIIGFSPVIINGDVSKIK